MINARHFVSCALLLSVLMSASAAQGEAAEALAAGRNLWRSFEYEDAIVQLRSVFADTSATVTQRLEALELMAVLHLSLRRQAQAQETFVRLLNLDPRHELTDPGYPPRVQQLFRTTRDTFLPQTVIEIEPNVPSELPNAPSVSIAATVAGETLGVERTLLFVRAAGDGIFRSAMMRRDGSIFTADVPTPSSGQALEYYIEVQAPSGYPLGRLGSAQEPVVIDASTSAETEPLETTPLEGDPLVDGAEPTVTRRPVYRRWWFWTIIGVAVAGGTTGLVIGLQPDDPSGTLGGLTLP